MKYRIPALAALSALFGCSSVRAQNPLVLRAAYEGAISPPAAEYFESAVDACARRRCEALLVELDTPGGLDASMRRIVKAFLGSPTPVIAYVAPAGARAASAGVFVMMAADIAAMAPGTNIGAAHPVDLGGLAGRGDAKPDAVMETKIANDASAYLAAIAARRGRNVDWARYVVQQSSSVPAAEAVRLKIVDLEAGSAEELLAAVDGRRVGERTLSVKGARIEDFPLSRRQRILLAISDPNVAMALLTLGGSGLLIELYSPGLILPGIVGAVSLITAFYSLQTLPAAYAGFCLIGLGVLFFFLELKHHAFGLIAAAGVTSIVLGGLMLSRNTGISPRWLWGSVAFLLTVTAALAALTRRILRRGAIAGVEALTGTRGLALTRLDPRGTIQVASETWGAESRGGRVEKGQGVIIEGRRGLTLLVRPE